MDCPAHQDESDDDEEESDHEGRTPALARIMRRGIEIMPSPVRYMIPAKMPYAISEAIFFMWVLYLESGGMQAVQRKKEIFFGFGLWTPRPMNQAKARANGETMRQRVK